MSNDGIPLNATDISICIVFDDKPEWCKWLDLQINKQHKYLTKHNIACEILLGTYNDEIKNYFSKTYINNNHDGIPYYDQVRIIPTDPYMPLAAKRNKVCWEAKGKYIAIMDSDDWYPELCLDFHVKPPFDKGGSYGNFNNTLLKT